MKDDGVITQDVDEVSSILVTVLKDIQYASEAEQYTGTLPFPDLPQLSEGEVMHIFESLASNKAMSFDLFSDSILKNEQAVKKLSTILTDLWSSKLNDLDRLSDIFKARLVALNKVHPNIPRKTEFRPIVIMSLVVKIMESRWLPKLKEYMITKMCPSQTGFVPGQGVFTNIFRVMRRVTLRTNQKQPVYALFIDFKSAYNYADHTKLFQRLEGILKPEEIQFQKAIYDKIVIQCNKAKFAPNRGVAQGSVASPAFFDIYTEPLLWELNTIIPLADIFAYADDILVLTDDIQKLKKCISIIESWSAANSLIINKSKSAVMEFIHRHQKTTNLQVSGTLMGYPIVNQYKYLGTWLNQKLTVDTQLHHIAKKTDFIRHRLSPTLYNASLDFRRNLWQVFILPLYEFILPLYHFEQAKTAKARVERVLRKSFKNFTGLRKTVNTVLLNQLMAYQIQERSSSLAFISEEKWRSREKGEMFKLGKCKGLEHHVPEPLPNICKNQPKLMIKYINMQTALCPVCLNQPQANGATGTIRARCSPEHLQKCHNIHIESVSSITQEVMKLTKAEEKKRWDPLKMVRNEILSYAEDLIEPNINKIKAFLNQKKT